MNEYICTLDSFPHRPDPTDRHDGRSGAGAQAQVSDWDAPMPVQAVCYAPAHTCLPRAFVSPTSASPLCHIGPFVSHITQPTLWGFVPPWRRAFCSHEPRVPRRPRATMRAVCVGERVFRAHVCLGVLPMVPMVCPCALRAARLYQCLAHGNTHLQCIPVGLVLVSQEG